MGIIPWLCQFTGGFTVDDGSGSDWSAHFLVDSCMYLMNPTPYTYLLYVNIVMIIDNINIDDNDNNDNNKNDNDNNDNNNSNNINIYIYTHQGLVYSHCAQAGFHGGVLGKSFVKC